MKTWITLLFAGIALVACGDTSPTMQTTTPASSAPAATKAPDENAALDGLRKINEAQSTYFKVNRRYALTFDELIEAHLLKNEPTTEQTGYDFKLRPAADAQTYKLSIAPVNSSSTTARYFFTDQSAVIHAETGKDASADSPAVK